ncbi:MAG TPA: prepilin peptidase, partial [Xanthobacteraceae bacterium]|nr:prepilin peptidase [Xanthobacteraceae bacterium]
MLVDVVRLLVFPGLMAFAAASDVVTMTISNKVSLALIGGFLVVAVSTGLGGSDIALHFAAGATVLMAGFACFACGWIGGGDAKLAAATALWFGFEGLLSYLFAASLLGGG